MIIYKTEEEIQAMRKSSQIVAKVLADLGLMIKPGVRTSELDERAERRARELGAKPAFKGYRGYPASLCISINEEIIHGIPSPRACATATSSAWISGFSMTVFTGMPPGLFLSGQFPRWLKDSSPPRNKHFIGA